SYYYDTLVGHQVEPLKIIILGTAGTKKSYLIKAIRNWLCDIAETKFKLLVLVLTLIGVAFFNINKATIYSMLLIPVPIRSHFDIEDKQLKNLQNKLQHVKYIILNEKSMIEH
ncbi:23605_t:CDS:1, partial [Cetraspora pellucida]